jgi:hypothetical protein
MNRLEAEESLRNELRPMEGVWIAHIPQDGRERRVEISVRDEQGKPSEAHLVEAARFLASLPDIRPRMEEALNSVPESDPLFPPIAARSWWLEAVSFVSDEPGRAVAAFVLNENGYEYIYVEYTVELEHGQVVIASARTC